MADRIHVDTDQFGKWSRMLEGVADDVQGVRSRLLRIDTSAEWWSEVPDIGVSFLTIFGSERLRPLGCPASSGKTGGGNGTIRAIAEGLSNYSRGMDEVSQKVIAAKNLFDGTEKRLTGVFSGMGGGSENDTYTGSGDNNPNVHNYDFSRVFGYSEDQSKWTDEMKKEYDEFVKSLKAGFDEHGNPMFYNDDKTIIFKTGLMTVFETSKKCTKFEKSTSKYNENGGYEKDSFSAGINKLGYDNKKLERKTEDGEYKQIGKEQDEWGEPIKENKGKTPKRVKTLLEVGVDRSHENSVAHKDIAWKNGANELDVNIDALKGESHASLKMGLYKSKVNKDGSVSEYLEPGVAAEIGLSATALSMDASYTHGTDDLNVTVNGNVAVGKIAGEAKGQLGWVDGKFAAGIDGSVEANLVEASGDVGVNVFGMKGSVGGSVNVGIGGHAKVGYYDGVISLDIGASIGVGASVRANIDVSGVVDTVKKVNSLIGNCKSALQKFKSWGGGIGGWR